MFRKLIYSLSFVLVLGSAAGVATADITSGLLVYWPFDEGAGSIVLDATGNGHDGTFNGAPQWVDGKYGKALHFDGVDDYITHALPGDQTYDAFTISVWVKIDGITQADLAGVFASRYPGGATGAGFQIDVAAATRVYQVRPNGGDGVFGDATADWVHLALVCEGTSAQLYYQNVLTSSTTLVSGLFNEFTIGVNRARNRFLAATVDEFRVYTRALTTQDIVALYEWTGSPKAQDPEPRDGATDVPRDGALGWSSGQSALSHDVYLGLVFDDVNNADRTHPRETLVSQGQSSATYDPAGPLEFGTTYYWRVDEVNQAADNAIYKGNVWSFTTEPYAYPIAPVAAKASSYQPGMEPEKTIDGSGLTGDLHGTEPMTMWLSAGVQPNWIQYEFDKVYKLHELHAWNSNQVIESFVGFGARKVVIETSADGTAWTLVADRPEFQQAPGATGYAANTTVNLGDVEAKYVKLTIDNSWGGQAVTGLSEVRFFYVPLQARASQPANAATGVSLDTTLDWRPGREATAHKVYFGTDSAAVANGTTPAETLTIHGYVPGSLDLGTSYYWRVDEVGAATYPGSIWSFTTQEYVVVDDFESYTAQPGEEIFSTWIDGYIDHSSGSQVGLLNELHGTFGETTVVHEGRQSMPLTYDNSQAPYYSEAVLTFDLPQDWAAHGIKSLSLWFQGTAGNSGLLYVKINNTKVPYSGDATDLGQAVWQAWNIDLAQAGKVNSVRTLTIGIEGAGAKGILYIDDIRLYPRTPEYITPVASAAAGL
jgi:Concanavalin A-like lectin/glucanases superfamily/F5/8 type C domain/Bacterial Ig-like domain